jgi:hypothetical protein
MSYTLALAGIILLLIWFVAGRYYEARQRRINLQNKRRLDSQRRTNSLEN